MDPLEKRYQDQLEPQVHPSTDGGDLNTGQQPNTQSFWQDNGLASDLNRTLERVQQQEAWLQSQSQPQWLHGTNNTAAPLSTAADGAGSSQALLVVDTSRADWQQRVNQWGSQADVLLIHPHQHGLEMVRDALSSSRYGRIELLVRDRGEAGLALGTDPITGADAAADRLRSNLGLGAQVALQLEGASAPPAVATTLLGDARELVDLARTSLGIAKEHGRLEAAVAAAYAADNQVAVLAAANAFLNGKLAPTILWASFERSTIRGAYVQERNTILINNSLQKAAEPILQSVLLEELGHWLEASTGQLADSPGDEGEGFAEMLLRGNTDGLSHSQNNQDQIQLEIDGQVMGAELASVTTSVTNLNGTSITIQFDEAMKFAGASDPNNALLTRFKLFKNGIQTDGSIAFSGYQFSSPIAQSLNLYLNAGFTISPGDLVGLIYDDYSQANDSFGVLENLNGADMANASGPVTNMTTSSGGGGTYTPPSNVGGSGNPYIISSSAAYESGYQRLNIGFSEPLSATGANTAVAASLFTLTLMAGGTTAVSVSSVSIDASIVRLGLSAPLPTGSYRINYNPPTLQSAGRLEDIDGNDIGSFSLDVFNNGTSTPTASSAPQLLSIQGSTFDVNTNSIKLTFDQDLNQTGIMLSTLLARFSLSVGDLSSNPTQVANAFSGVSFDGNRSIKLALNGSALSSFMASSPTLNITYTDPNLNSDDSGNVVEGLTGMDTPTFTTSVSTTALATNHAPILTAISIIPGAIEDSYKEISYADLAAAANATDIDGDLLRFRIDAISAGTLEKWSGSAWTAVIPGTSFLTTGEKLQWKGPNNANNTINAFTVSAFDGSLASSPAVQVQVNVSPINDAPVRTSTLPTAISVAEDSSNTSAIPLGLSGLAYATGGATDESSQTFTYTISGIPFFINLFQADGITAVTAGSTLTLTQLQGLRYKTLPNANGTGNITWTVQDSGGTANGGLDTLIESLAITVAPVNDAPSATGSAALAAILEDAATAAGSTVAALFSANFSDSTDISGTSSANTHAGIAITANAATASQGKWQWQASSSSTWTDIATTGLADGTALYLASSTKLRFLPAANFNGTPGSLTTRLVDNSASLTNGNTVNVSSNGGTTAISAATVALGTSITAVNDAPVASGSASSLPAVLEEALAPAGETVSNLFSANFSDSTDTSGFSTANSFVGIVVTANAATTAQGTWEWQASGGSTWTGIGSGLTDAAGLYLEATTRLRFRPGVDFTGAPGLLTTRLVDNSGSALTNGNTVNVSSNGGTTAISTATVALGTSITAVNDAPVLTSSAPTPISVAEDSSNGSATTLGLSSLTYGPAGGSYESNQTFTYTLTGIPAFINVFQADGTTAVTAGSTLTLTQLQGLTYKTIANANGTGNLTWTVRDSGGTANGGVDTLNQSLAITVNSVNDAPVQSSTTPVLPAGQETIPYIIRAQDLLVGFSDVDAGDQLSITNLQATNGTLVNNNNGTWTFTPVASNSINLGQIQEDNTRTLTVDDLLGGSRTAIQVQLYYNVRDTSGASRSGSSSFEMARASSVNSVTVSNLSLTQGQGNLVANANNTWTFTPAANWYGSVAFNYDISTGGPTIPYTGNLTVQAVDDAPVLAPSFGSGTEDGGISAFMNGFDIEGTPLSVVRVRQANTSNSWTPINQDTNSPATTLSTPYGTLRIQPYGSFSFLADGAQSQALAVGQQAQTTFTYEATDGALISTSTVTFTITGSNDIPLVNADLRTIAEDAMLIVPAQQGVLANDIDPDAGATLRVHKISTTGQPAVELGGANFAILSNDYGTLLMRADGGYSFVADGSASQTLAAGQSATTSFAYQVDDGLTNLSMGGIATSTLTFTISGTNDAPLINGALNLGSIQEDGTFPITAAQLLATASDVDSPSQALTVQTVSVDPQLGQISSAGSGLWLFTPAADWNGSAEIRYVISDGSSSSVPRTLANGLAIRGDRLYLQTNANNWQGAQQEAQNLGGNLASIGSSAKQAFLEQLNIQGWIGFNDSQQEGQWAWSDGSPITFSRWYPGEPNNEWMGQDGDFAAVLPGGLWGEFSSSVFNTPGLAEIPFIRRGDSAYVIVNAPSWDQGQTNAMRLGGNLVTINNAAENAWLVSTFGNNVYNAYIGLNDALVEGDWRWSSGEFSSYRHWAPGEPNNAGDTATSDYVLMHLWSYNRSGTWNDGENYGVGKGIAEINLSGLGRLAVNPVDDAPRPTADQAAAQEDQLLSVTAANGLLSNDRDPEGATLQLLGIADPTSANSFTALSNGNASLTNGYGTLTVQADGAYTFLANGPLSQQIPQGSSQTVSFNYRVSDGSLESASSLTLTISGSNDPTVVVADERPLSEDQNLNVPADTGVLANDSDSDLGTTLTVTTARLQGTSAFTTLSNGQALISTSYGDLSLYSDGRYSFAATGFASQSLAPGQLAQVVFDLTVSDGIASQPSILTLTIAGGNDLPQLVGSQTQLPDGVDGQPYDFTTAQLLQGFSDVDSGDQLDVANLSSSAGTLQNLGNGNWRFIRNTENRVNLGSSLEDTTKPLSLNQLLGGSLGAITIPIVYNVIDRFGGSVTAQQSFDLQRGASIANPTIANLQVITNGAGSLSGNQTSGWLFTPTVNFNGTVQFSYDLVTSNGSSAYIADLVISSVNDPPVVTAPASFTTSEDTPLTLAGLSVADADGDALTLSLQVGQGSLQLGSTQGLTSNGGIGSPANPLELVGNATALNAALASLVYVPAANANGSTALLITARDANATGLGGPALISRTVPITMIAVNDAPLRLSGAVTNLNLNEDAPRTSLGLSQLSYGPGGGGDETNQTLSYTVNTVPAFTLGAIMRADGTVVEAGQILTLLDLQGLQFQANPNGSGTGSFSFNVGDGAGGTLTESLTISVAAQNDAPVRRGTPPSQVVVSEASGITSLGLEQLTYAAAVPLSGPGTVLATRELSNNGKVIGLLDPSSGSFTALTSASYQGMLGDEVVAQRPGSTELFIRQGNAIVRIDLGSGTQTTLLNTAPMLLGYRPNGDALVVYDPTTAQIQAVNLTTGASTTLATGVLAGASIQAGGFASYNATTDQVTLLTRTGPAVVLTTVTLGTGAQASISANLPDLQALAGLSTQPNQVFGLWEDAAQRGVLLIGRIDLTTGSAQTLARLSTGTNSGGFSNYNVDVNADGIAFVHYSGLHNGRQGSWISSIDTKTGTVLGATENPGDLIRGSAVISNEGNQQLQVRITALPDAALGRVVLADGTTAVLQGNTYTVAELQTMQFRSSRDGNGSGSFSYVVEDNGTTNGAAAPLGLAETISIRVLPVNDQPLSSGRAVDPVFIVDNSNLKLNAGTGLYQPIPLGLADVVTIPPTPAVAYGAGGAADEATQALSYTITALPRAVDSLLQFTTTATALTANARLSTVYQAGDVLTATLITANQNPIPIRYTVQAADISLTSAVATRTSIAAGLAAAINATPALNGVVQAAVTNGDPERLSFTAAAAGVSIELVSDTSLGTVLLRNPNNQLTAVAPGQVLNLEQIKALEFRPSEGITDLSAAARLGQFSFTVNDDGSAATGGGASRQQRISILVETNKASARSGARITGITSDEQAIAAAMSLDPTNPTPGLVDSLDSQGNRIEVKGLSTSLYSQLDSNNPLYLADIGGKGAIDGDAINYTPAAVPFLFDLPVPNSTPGAQLTHRLTYKSTLTGQFRSNAEGNSYSLVAPVAGFSLSSAGSWSFDPLNAAYQALQLNQTQTVTVNYREQTTGPARSFTLELSRIELGDGDTTIMATPTGPDANRTSFSRGDWIASSSEGREKDRYFKFISEATLVSYGAVDTGEVNEDGDKVFAWTGTLQTADGLPLTLLDGTPITSPGYYDFTRRGGAGDGVEFIYQTVTEKGKEVDYIVGMKFFLTNNMYGDNDPARDNIRDPGAPITVMKEIGEITYGYASYENVETSDTFDFQTSVNSIRTLFTGNPNPFDGGAGRVIQSTVDGSGRTPQQAGQAATVISAGGGAGGAAPGQSALTLQGGEDGNEADSGNQDTQGASKVAQGAGANGKQQRPDGADRDGPTERGLKLDPLQQLATAATAEPSTLLEQLSDTNILGTNLLDALALGAGVLYLLYGPKAIEASKGGLRGWLAGGIGRRQGAAAAVPGERSVMALFLMRQPSGAAQLVAARVGQGTLQLLAQEDLPAQAAGNRLAEPLQTLLERLPQDRYELLLLDPRLQAAAAATAGLDQLSERRQSLATEQLSAPLAACSDNELAQLRAWLNKPSGTLPEDLPLIQLLQQRQQRYANDLPEQQATMASLIELSLALAWSEQA